MPASADAKEFVLVDGSGDPFRSLGGR